MSSPKLKTILPVLHAKLYFLCSSKDSNVIAKLDEENKRNLQQNNPYGIDAQIRFNGIKVSIFDEIEHILNSRVTEVTSKCEYSQCPYLEIRLKM